MTLLVISAVISAISFPFSGSSIGFRSFVSWNFYALYARSPCQSAVLVIAPARARFALAFVEEGDAWIAYLAAMVVVPISSFRGILLAHIPRPPLERVLLESLQTPKTAVMEVRSLGLLHVGLLKLAILRPLLYLIFQLPFLLRVRHLCLLRRLHNNQRNRPQQLHHVQVQLGNA